MDDNNPYTKMQKESYKGGVYQGSINNTMQGRPTRTDHFRALNEMEDMHKYLFKGVPKGGRALDFGCGPGRAIVKYQDRFDSIDGVDISPQNIDKAIEYLEWSGISTPSLWVNNGVDLQEVPSNTYDAVYSIQTMIHIGVYDIRRNLLEEMYRVLKPGGWVCIQMGYGATPSSKMVEYYDNKWNATETNGRYGTNITSPSQPQTDLEEIGFTGFSYDLRDMTWTHPKWIYFRGQK
jgi:ubiquinone/menaquinone biosynthesis C-methylase UbiE